MQVETLGKGVPDGERSMDKGMEAGEEQAASGGNKEVTMSVWRLVAQDENGNIGRGQAERVMKARMLSSDFT